VASAAQPLSVPAHWLRVVCLQRLGKSMEVEGMTECLLLAVWLVWACDLLAAAYFWEAPSRPIVQEKMAGEMKK